MKILNDYPYLYETHCHSAESSACARDTAVDMAKAHKEAGYTGMILTNHNWGGNTAVSRELAWDDLIDVFFEPCLRAKEWGDANDFQVFTGYEAGYDGTEFLIYGIDIEWMHAHPELRDASIAEQFDIIHSCGGLVVHAHPFREAFYIKETRLFPEYVDAIEGVNASHCPINGLCDNRIFNEKALKYAKELGMVITGGSDTHSVNLLGGGMAFPKKLRDIKEFISIVKNASAADYRVTDGIDYYDACGGLL
ncbi:MAG: PHP domain-containing protein [Lachnospiraceae bacterium]|nr:PHP domain-containing protein [Lachnospiraceae bacterium]